MTDEKEKENTGEEATGSTEDFENAPSQTSETGEYSTASFPVDIDFTQAEVVDKKRKIVLTHHLRTPNINQAATYERDTAMKSEVNEDDEITPKNISDKAAAVLYDSLCEKVVIRKIDDDKFERTLTSEEIRKLTNEQKADAISQFLNNLHVDVSSLDADEFDFLFENEGDLRVDIFLGRKKEDPDFAFAFIMKRPDAQTRENLRDALSKVKFKRNDVVMNTQVTQNLPAAVRFFDKYFDRAENVLVAQGVYDAAKREAFLKSFNPKWKAQVVQSVINFF
jgi:hypothetical protein